MKTVSVIGADVLYVERGGWFVHTHEEWMKIQKRRPITLDQIEALSRQMTHARAITPVTSTDERVQFQRRHAENVTIFGTTDGFLQTMGMNVAAGRFISGAEAQSQRAVCVIGWSVATNLFGNQSGLGHKIMIGGHSFEVIGILEEMGSFLDGGSLDNQAILPLPAFRGTFQSFPDYQIQVKALNPSDLEETKEEIRVLMRKIRRVAPAEPEDFAINQQDQFVELFHQIAGTIAAVGLFITGLSLFVGGIGIMNIMFVSVAERTREIGIRKAIGAKKRTILVQFLIEAACVCLIGGAIALAIAWPITLLMQKFFPATLSPLVVSIALFVSLGTGVVSGFFPAWRAARMNVIDALRNE
jgi:putative ABC transport system permease protein